MVSRAAATVTTTPRPDRQHARGAAAVGRHLEVIGAPEERADFAGRRVGVRADHARHRTAADPNFERRRPASRSKTRRSMLVTRLPKRSTRSTCPVMVSGADSSTTGAGISSRWIAPAVPAERAQVGALRQPGRRRRKTIAAFERAAHARARVPALGQFDDLARADARRRPRSARRCRARRTGSRRPRRRCRGAAIPLRDRRRRETRWPAGNTGTPRPSSSAPPSTSCGGDVVRDVDERRVGTDPEHHALHRAGVVIPRAEVRQQGDDRPWPCRDRIAERSDWRNCRNDRCARRRAGSAA